MAQQWYIKFPEKTSGPFSTKQVRKLASIGRLKPDYEVSDNGKHWYEAARLRGLKFGNADDQVAVKRGEARMLTCDCGETFAVPVMLAGAKRTCPKCGKASQVPSNFTSVQPRSVFACIICGAENEPGTGRCIKCKANLRPFVLAFTAWAMIVIGVIYFLISLLFMVGVAALSFDPAMSKDPNSINPLVGAIGALLGALANLWVVYIGYTLRQGHYRAWIWSQIIIAIHGFPNLALGLIFLYLFLWEKNEYVRDGLSMAMGIA